MTSKDELRAKARKTRAWLAEHFPEHAQWLARFAGDLALANGIAVASYWPIRDEADPRLLAAALAGCGHAILLPGVGAPNEPLQFRLWREGDPLKTNAFGVGEPELTAPALEPGALLVPLLAYDAQGFRLGYGGGYYDRTLAARRAGGHVLAIGVGYAGQEIEGVPRDGHDEKLDMIVTEQGVRRFG